ncbi:hypothetical protein, partial [Pyrobaculum arsenaticum]|uniref:hypothetical protein n=1 Tax=Pyrobaculum arsenaticum TaxID=121277 RepID=UPI001CA45AB3
MSPHYMPKDIFADFVHGLYCCVGFIYAMRPSGLARLTSWAAFLAVSAGCCRLGLAPWGAPACRDGGGAGRCRTPGGAARFYTAPPRGWLLPALWARTARAHRPFSPS